MGQIRWLVPIESSASICKLGSFASLRRSCQHSTMDSGQAIPRIEREVAWRMAVELFNRPTWPTAMWNGSPADAARQLVDFADVMADAAQRAKGDAPFLVERTVQVLRSATVCAAMLDHHGGNPVRCEGDALLLCEALAPFAIVANQVLNDLVERYGFREVLMRSSAQLPRVLAGHEEFTHHALRDGIQVIVYWSDATHQPRRTTAGVRSTAMTQERGLSPLKTYGICCRYLSGLCSSCSGCAVRLP